MKYNAPSSRQQHGSNSNPLTHPTDSRQPTIYEIRIEGQLGCTWADWFSGMTIAPQENGETLLRGPVIDQAALYGLLKKVRDLGMVLVSVHRVTTKVADAPEVK